MVIGARVMGMDQSHLLDDIFGKPEPDEFKARWFWCGQCQTPAIKCDDCKNTSCNGGGCEQCRDDFQKVNELCEKRKVPSFPIAAIAAPDSA